MREWLFALAVAVLAALLILVGWWMRGVVEAYHVSITTPIVVEAAEPVPPPPAESVLCACGCGRDVQPDVYEHYKDEDGNVFFDLDCVMRYYGIRCVD